MFVNQVEKFVVGALSAIRTFFDGVCGAVHQVVAHKVTAGAAEGFLYGRYLHQNVGTIALIFHHFLDAANLAGDACEAAQGGGLDFRINFDGLAFISAGAVRILLLVHGRKPFNRRLLVSTLTELMAMAALAMTGLSRMPSAG